MSSDQLVSAPAARQIRIAMLVNGQQQGGLKQFGVSNAGHFNCDKWDATIGLQGCAQGFGASFWALEQTIQVELLASLEDGAELAPVAGGFVDRVSIDMATQVMKIDGRDFTAPLIDNVLNDKFVNQTSSQVATVLAQRRGLVPQVTATKTPIGRFNDSEYNHVSDNCSEYRLLSELAQHEGFDFYAVGKTLFFGPTATDPTPLVLMFKPSSSDSPQVQLNAPNIVLTQNKTLAKGATVQVRSWNYQTGKPIISTWTAKPKRGGSNGAGSQGVTLTRAQKQGGQGSDGPFWILKPPGLTQQQADALAQKTLRDYIDHERGVEVTNLPAIIGVDSRRTLRLVGTGTAYDQDYGIRDIRRTFGWDGAVMSITAKSASPNDESSV